jgi:protein ImuB
MRWLAIHLPALPLEVYERASALATPLAIGIHRNGERILRCNPAAAACGIRPGLGVGAARALCARLAVLPQRPELEREALERLAAWAIRFTPHVSLAPPRALLLDAGASLRLFGGADALIGQVDAGLAGLGYLGRLALAPTPLGALVLAMQGWGAGGDGAGPQGSGPAGSVRRSVADGPALRAALNGLPLPALGLSARERDDLRRLGLRQIGDLLRLPHRGLRERLGPRRMDWLERLLGESPDPRPVFTPPLSFAGRLELPAELTLTESLIFPCRRLLYELGGLLAGRQAAVQRLDWRLGHADLPDTCFSLGSAALLGDPGGWLGLLRGRLERLELTAPVRAIALAAPELRPLAPERLELFPKQALPGRGPDTALLDRLRARLGRDAVHGLALAADHRPERAWRWAEPGETGTGIPRLDRPLWLLPEPMPLDDRDGRPWLAGLLDLGNERERIDTGWWDDLEVARDYFVATTEQGERLWIYRELKGRQAWHLHGVFG